MEATVKACFEKSKINDKKKVISFYWKLSEKLRSTKHEKTLKHNNISFPPLRVVLLRHTKLMEYPFKQLEYAL